MTGDPDAPWDVAFKWQDSTFFDRAVLGRLPGDTSIINGESVDISKTAVDAAMKRAFGYSAAVDPMRYAGLVVQKSDQNAKHDGTVVECPVTSGSVVPGCVYQRLIDNTVHGRAIYEFRVPVIGGQIPLVFVKYRPIERRFMIRNTIAQMTEAADVFSDDEITSLVAFSREMRLDYGELDVLRDNNDGRLYVVDANNTPHGPPKRLSPTQQQEAVARLGDALVALLRESGYSRSASRTPST
ncbi:MAG TPA: hypothetical protein VFW08_13900 [bacterium]|nr:hypothetical protein [bacterium]